jgi:hypothetical protein
MRAIIPHRLKQYHRMLERAVDTFFHATAAASNEMRNVMDLKPNAA